MIQQISTSAKKRSYKRDITMCSKEVQEPYGWSKDDYHNIATVCWWYTRLTLWYRNTDEMKDRKLQ